MANIVFGSYMVRYPLGGVLSSSLQWLVGLKRLGHDVTLVEKSGWPNSCFDPSRNEMTDDPTYGTRALADLLRRFDLGIPWCFVDSAGHHHGLDRRAVEQAFRSADLFIDRGTHGTWAEEAEIADCKVLIDGEPAHTQMRMEARLAEGDPLPEYDFYYSVGRNVGTERSPAPTAGRSWRPLFHPVVTEFFSVTEPPTTAPFSTITNWKAHEPVEYRGQVYGQKDEGFRKFIKLPMLTSVPLEIAVAGKEAPLDELRELGWRLEKAHDVTVTVDAYYEYIRNSMGEFSASKEIFAATNSGWFSDRSAVYLACGRPVVLQETGFSDHLPCGTGLFNPVSVEDAAAALDEIAGNYHLHSQRAREIALEFLEARKVLGALLDDVGL